MFQLYTVSLSQGEWTAIKLFMRRHVMLLNRKKKIEEMLKAECTGAVLFNTGCNEQVFSPKCWKKNWRRLVLSFSRKTQKTHTLIPKNDVNEPKARRLGYFNNHLNC